MKLENKKSYVYCREMEMLTRPDCTEYLDINVCCVVIKMMRKYGCHQTPSQYKSLAVCMCCVRSFDFVSFHIHIICHWPLQLWNKNKKGKHNENKQMWYNVAYNTGAEAIGVRSAHCFVLNHFMLAVIRFTLIKRVHSLYLSWKMNETQEESHHSSCINGFV